MRTGGLSSKASLTSPQVFIETPSQRPRYLQRKFFPTGGEETKFPTLFGGCCKARCARIVIVRERLLRSPPTTLELHQAFVVTGSSAKVQRLIAMSTPPRDSLPHEQIVGGEVEIAFIRCPVGIPERCARCEQDHAGNDVPFVLRQEKLHITACRKGIPQPGKELKWLRRHSMFLTACLQVEVIEVPYVFRLLRKAHLHTISLRFFNLALNRFAQTRPDRFRIGRERQKPADVQVAFHQSRVFGEYRVDTGTEFQIFRSLLACQVNRLLDQLISTAFVGCQQRGIIGKRERDQASAS